MRARETAPTRSNTTTPFTARLSTRWRTPSSSLGEPSAGLRLRGPLSVYLRACPPRTVDCALRTARGQLPDLTEASPQRIAGPPDLAGSLVRLPLESAARTVGPQSHGCPPCRAALEQSLLTFGQCGHFGSACTGRLVVKIHKRLGAPQSLGKRSPANSPKWTAWWVYCGRGVNS